MGQITPYTRDEVSSYIGQCLQVDMQPSLDGMVAIETATLSGAEADAAEAAVREAWALYAPAILAQVEQQPTIRATDADD